jgi:putative transposase
MKFVFIAKLRNIWPVAWLCEAMGVSRSGFHAWLNRPPSARSRSDETTVGRQVKESFLARDRPYGAQRARRAPVASRPTASARRRRPGLPRTAQPGASLRRSSAGLGKDGNPLHQKREPEQACGRGHRQARPCRDRK